MDRFTLEKLEFDKVRQILARYCRSSLGVALAGHIGPSCSPEIVRRWLDETTQMVDAITDHGPPPFGGVTNIAEELGRALPSGTATGEDFCAIASTLEGVGAIRRWAGHLEESKELIRGLGAQLSDFGREVQAIRSVVDMRGDVLETASPALGRLRQGVNGTRQRIHEVIYGYLRRSEVAKILQHPTVTLHEDRFVLPIKSEHRHHLTGVVHRASKTGATLFIEPSESVEMNNQLVELMDEERREVARLLNELAILVSHRRQEILESLGTMAQIDLISSKAQYAAQFECISPEIEPGVSLQLHQVRHPLLVEQCYQEEVAGTPPEQRHHVVPIDVRLGEDFDVLMITGSNTGGKTVALKTVGLAVLMAQAGMHIPAGRGSRLPLFGDVLLDVGDEQSLQQSLSTFGAHIQRINYIVRHADKGSLVLLDELGSGTDPDEGAAIGQAILDELSRIGCLCMVTTHLGLLKAYAITHNRVDNASVEFDTRTLRPTYHLRIGEPGESHAITVAAAMGLPPNVIASARGHLDDKTQALHRAIRSTTAVRRKSEQARSDAHVARMAAETTQEKYSSKLEDLQHQQAQFEHWLASLSELKAGDAVQVARLGKSGRLVRVQFNKQIAVVDVENIQHEIPLGELVPDLGQGEIRREITTLRDQVAQQARQAEAMRKEAQRLQSENQRVLAQQQAQVGQYQKWVEAIGAARVGQMVTISRPPGQGKLVELDLVHSRAKVQTPQGVLDLRVQDLFPQSGVYGPKPQRGRPGRPGPAGAAPIEDTANNRPVFHRKADTAGARVTRLKVMAIQPGQPVYVVPFQKRATLIRFNDDKTLATVQSGAFEMQIPVTDLEPPHDGPADGRPGDRPNRPPRPQANKPAEGEGTGT